MLLLAPCFAISFVLPIVLSDGNLGFRANLTKLNPPTNITIVDRQLGELTITWKDNLSEDMKKWSDVRYLFEFKYFDSDDWQEDSRHQVPEYMRTFELHRGVSLRVKNILLDKQRSIVINESNWTVKNIQPPPGDQETLVSNFSCIIYNHSSMNCTWRKGSKAPTDTEYVMYYRQSETTRRCIHYFTKNGRSGCQVDQGIYDAEENILICVNGSNNTGTIRSYYAELDPQEYEIYNPPVNLKVLPNLTVKWDMPPGYVTNINCFAFELEVTDLDEENVHLFNAYWMLLMLAIITAMTGLLLLFAFRRCKVLETVFEPIPDPQKKFKALFEEYNGDFQNWINYQIPISKADECHPVVVEESSTSEA
ncbi:hypothetical protein scyTo_0015555 [Scyliorhinus torazame]|uniref:Type I cytokine receptor cytokine-binding domain-containing protein n=1 Tax=Scyliorhinus torazame TaxID=75743 RepID=A0A401PUQ2_SCYTO|nr:hypothetical protein [Scyliorhinus torazame]